MTTLTAVAFALAVMVTLGKAAQRFTAHTHEHGHCGYSGCQAPTRRAP